MSFINTVEKVGDVALTRSLIDRSITELDDNITTSIRRYAFRMCTALEHVNFPNVTSVGLGAFWQCTALTRGEFSSCVAFANNAFYGCTALTALILRCADQICTITGTPFAASAIANGTGYIYVPAALVDQYKASWTAYANQIRAIEDYVGIVDTYTWAGVAANIADGSYATVYQVGDLVPLDLGSEGLVNMQIVAFDADDLADGSGKAAISWVAQELLATKHRMNPAVVTNDDGTYQEGTGAIGGWEKCEMRAYLNDTILPMIPNDVQGMLKAVVKYSTVVNTSGSIVKDLATDDVIWVPSHREIFSENTLESLPPTYSISSKEKGNVWWTRTSASFLSYRSVNKNGSGASTTASADAGVILGFCT